MAILTLAKGDPAALKLLKEAVAARYGLRPLLVESLRLTLSAKRPGFLGLPAQTHVHLALVGSTHWRWQERTRLLGIPIASSLESFDGGACYTGKIGAITSSTEAQDLSSYQRLLWAVLALLITPLTEEGVIVKAGGERTFAATLENAPHDVATITLNADYTLNKVQVQRHRPGDAAPVNYVVTPGRELQTLSGLILPVTVEMGWEDKPRTVYTITHAEVNETIPLTEFTVHGG